MLIMGKVTSINDLGPQYVEELAFMGIKSTRDLLKWISTSKGIESLEKNTHIDHHLLQSWAQQLSGKK